VTVFADLDLSAVIGLESCRHLSPSMVDFRTMQKSGALPIQFLQGIGLPNHFIENLHSIFDHAIHYHSCFISYSAKDQEFADRIHADLQSTGVRCWFAPHDMPIGGKIIDEIDAAIRLRDKLLQILSAHSIKSSWVEDEVTKAFQEERKRGQTVLFPIRIDDAVIETNEAWAAKLRANRNIGDFRRWKNHIAYNTSLDRVIRDLSFK
jgi:TIR domain